MNFSWRTVRTSLGSDRFIWMGLVILALIPRLAPSWQFMDPDSSAFWLTRIREFADGLSGAGIAHLAPAIHPGVTLLWLTAPVELLHRVTGPWHFIHGDPLYSYLYALKLPVALATSLLVGSAWWFAKQALPRRLALWFALFLALDPLYLQYSRYIHLDALVTGFSIAGLLAFWLGMTRPSRRHQVLGLLLMTLAGLTRINGFLMLGFALLMWIIVRPTPGRMRRQFWLGALIVFLTAVIVWPPLLFAPRQILHLQHTGLGLVLSTHEVPPNVDVHQPIRSLLYPLFILTRDSLLVIGLAALGFVFALRRLLRPETRFWRWMMLFALYYFVALLLEPKQLDRYALPLIGPLILFAASGADQLWHWGIRPQKLLRVALLLILVGQSIIIWHLAPYYQTYENLFGRLLQHTPLRVSQAFSPAWGEGMSQAADFIRLPDGSFPSNASWYASEFCVYGMPRTTDSYPLWAKASTTCPAGTTLLATPATSTWIILSRDQIAQRVYPKLLDDIARLGWQPTKIISLNGLPYIWIYRNTGGLRESYSLTGI